MPRVFQNLYRLAHDAGQAGANAYEDFFTEILAWWLSSSGQTAPFLRGCGIQVRDGPFSVESQREFAPLRGHATASVVDMVLTSDAEVVFWESKIDSGEGDHQLRRYADHLASSDFGEAQRYLIYATRDYDPKDDDFASQGVQFHPIRWYRVAEVLQKIARSLPADPLLEQLLDFMKDHKLQRPRRFGPAHVAAMRFHSETVSLMKEALDGKVRAKLEAVLPGKSVSYCYAGRYPDYPLSVGLYPVQFELEAYFFSDGKCEYPMVGVECRTTNPYTTEAKKRRLAAFAKRRKNWTFYSEKNCGIWAEKSLDRFLPGRDHVAEIEAFLVKLLDEARPLVAKIKR